MGGFIVCILVYIDLMVSTADFQQAVFFVIGLVSIALTAVFRSSGLYNALSDYYPWLEIFNIKSATTVYGLVAFISIMIMVFLRETKSLPRAL
jgi:FlaA1/EpsC-like NDP-sugar epimerase